MKIKVKTLTGKRFDVEITGKESIEQLKRKLHKDIHIPLTGQRIIYAGKQLKSGSLLDAGFLEGDFLVVVVVRKKPGDIKPPEDQPQPKPQRNASTGLKK